MITKMKKTNANYHDLIPGLPSELAIECLIRVPYQFQSGLKSVCRSWKTLLSDSSFVKERRRCNKAELLLCLVQPLLPPIPAAKTVGEETLVEESSEDIKQNRVFKTPRFGLTIYNATTSTWNRVAFPKTQQIPLFCECVAIQDAGKILLIGGWDPETLQPVKDVYIIELTGERRWRKGASMKEPRSFFACAAPVGKTKIYVAGGHDDQKNALQSAEVYDVEKDEWITIAPMIEGRDECAGFATETDLGFCVVSGYKTESQGKFRSDGEIYDPDTNSWSKIENIWRFPEISPRGRIVEGSSVKIPAKGSSVFAVSEGGVMMMKMKMSDVQVPYGFSTLPFSHASIYV